MTADTTPQIDATLHAQLTRLMDGYLSTQLLYVAAHLGIADILRAGPLSSVRSPGQRRQMQTPSTASSAGS